VLVRSEKLSFVSVDKPVEIVDNKWIDLTSTPPSTPSLFKKRLSTPRYTRK
jgi:hypothetical protein